MAQIRVDIQLAAVELDKLIAQIADALEIELTGEQNLRLKGLLMRQQFESEEFIAS